MTAVLRAAVLPLLAVLVLVGGALAASPREDPRPPTSVAVGATTYACPAGDDLARATGQVAPGRAATARALPGDEELDDVVDPRAWTTSEVDGDAVVVEQRGRASGAVGFVSGVASEDDGGGLLVGACPGVVDDAWFTGLGSGARHESRLVLTNLAGSTAVADVTLWGPDGRVATAERSSVVVDAGSTVALPLADLASGEPDLAVRVERRRGALSVAAVDTSTNDAAGSEVVDPAEAPRRRQVLAGVPAGSDGRTLRVLNPGSATARVDVEVLGEKGPFVPEGLERLRVGPGRTTAVELPRSVGSGRVAVRLRSTEPVVGSVSVQPSDDDLAVVEPAPVLTGPAVVPLDLGTSTDAPELVLSSPADGATARLVAHAADGSELAEASLEVAAGTTVGVDLGDDDVIDVGDAAYVVLEAVGPLVGAVTLEDGDLVASLALRPAPVSVAAPQVRPAP